MGCQATLQTAPRHAGADPTRNRFVQGHCKPQGALLWVIRGGGPLRPINREFQHQ
jgi:hypothetical protein